MNVQILPIALITLALLACNDSTTNVITDKPDPDSSSSSWLVTSSSSMGGSSATSSSAIGTLISSGQSSTGSYSSPANTKDTLLLTNLGTLRVSINDGTKGVPSTKSTVSVSGGTGSLKIDFVADDANSDGREWEGGQTMVLVEYTLSDPLSLLRIAGMRIESVYMDSVRHIDTTYRPQWENGVEVQVPIIEDVSKRPDPNYFGFIFTSVTGAIHDTRCYVDISATDTPEYYSYHPSYFTDSDNDGWMTDISKEYRGGSKLCTEDGCDLTKVAFYFWTYNGTGSIIINGLSLLTE